MIYIYILRHPLTNKIRYVGKTNNIKKRLKNHINATRRGVKSHKNNWIKGLLNEGLKPKMEVIDEIDSDNWVWLEQYWIAQFKAWGFNLTNMTDGGENPPSWLGRTHSDEYKEVRRKLMTEDNPMWYKTKEEKVEQQRKATETKKFRGWKPSNHYLFKKPVIQYSLDGKFVARHESATDAAKAVGLKNSSGVGATCRGERNKAGGFKWEYE